MAGRALKVKGRCVALLPSGPASQMRSNGESERGLIVAFIIREAVKVSHVYVLLNLKHHVTPMVMVMVMVMDETFAAQFPNTRQRRPRGDLARWL